MCPASFADLLARARAGDDAAMSELIANYEPQIRRVAHSRLGPMLRAGFDSMDIVQSVHRSLLIGLRKNRFTFSSDTDLVALAVTMVTRKVARRAEQARREQEVLRLYGLILAKQPAGSPDRTVDLADEVRALLEGLGDLDRGLLMCHLEGLGTPAAAARLGIKPDSLRVRRNRLFHRLRKAGLDLS